jgi:hypothetical protein
MDNLFILSLFSILIQSNFYIDSFVVDHTSYLHEEKSMKTELLAIQYTFLYPC